MGIDKIFGMAVTGTSGRLISKIIKTILKQGDMEVVADIGKPNTHLGRKDIGEVISVKVDVQPRCSKKNLMKF